MLSITIFFSVWILKSKGMSVPVIGRISQVMHSPSNKGNKTIIGGQQENSLLERLQAFLETERLSVKKTHNSLGFDDEEWRIKKPANTYRIIALGDSMTQGLWLPINSSWPKQLERKLNMLNLSIHFEVFNMGKGGWGTYDEVETFKNIALNYSPDMVILQYYNHDWTSPEVKTEAEKLWENFQKGKYELPQTVEDKIKQVNTSQSVISALFYGIALQEYESRVNWEEEWNKWTEKPLVELINLTKQKNIKLIVIAWDIESKEKNKLTSLLSKYRIPFYDFSEYLPFSLPLCSSPTRLPDCHLSSLGYEIVANKTLDTIKNYFSGNEK